MEEYKLIEKGEIIVVAMKNHIEEKIKDKDWTEVLIKSFEDCSSSIPGKMDEIEKELAGDPINIQKHDCNTKVTAIAGCMNVQSFLARNCNLFTLTLTS